MTPSLNVIASTAPPPINDAPANDFLSGLCPVDLTSMLMFKAIYSDEAIYGTKRAIILSFAFVWSLFFICTCALGQPLTEDSTAISIIEATEEVPIQIELATTQSLPSLSAETFCSYDEGPQSIRLRKNVLGCKACYSIPSRDEIWIVSARNNVCDPDNIDLLKVKKLANNTWQPSCLSDLTESHRCDKSRSTLVYVHGNQTNYEYGVARGFQFYDNLFIQNDCPRPPVRLVLWLWKSEQEQPRPLPDYLIKAKRAVAMGRTLTNTLEAFEDRKIAVTGFSLGAQVILSSMEQMEPYCDCSAPAAGDNKYQIALVAPATDPGYICDVINRNVETSIVDMSTIMANDKDRVIKAMRLVIRRECPEARDKFADLAREQHFPLGPLEVFEVAGEIGRKHAIENYTQSPTIQRAMNRVIHRIAASTF